MKTSMIVVAAAAAAALGTGMFAETAEARKLFASRAKVRAACSAHGGDGYGLTGNGDYGCSSKGGWIHCDANGECDGGRYDDFDNYRERSRPRAALPRARGSR